MSSSIALNHLVLPVESRRQKYLYFRKKKKRGWIQANKDMLGEVELWCNSQFLDCPAKKSGSALPKYSVAKSCKAETGRYSAWRSCIQDGWWGGAVRSLNLRGEKKVQIRKYLELCWWLCGSGRPQVWKKNTKKLCTSPSFGGMLEFFKWVCSNGHQEQILLL